MTADQLSLSSDGRRARRDRNRTAVVDAMLGLLEEGVVPPSTDAIAERAGVSVSSIFRYFEGIDDLQHETIDRHLERFAPLYDVPSIGLGGRDDRIDRLVGARLSLYEAIAPIGRLVRARAMEQPRIARSLADARAMFAGQIRTNFATEMDDLPPAQADDLVSLIDSLTSFEAWDLQRTGHRRSDRQIRRAWVAGITVLVGQLGQGGARSRKLSQT